MKHLHAGDNAEVLCGNDTVFGDVVQGRAGYRDQDECIVEIEEAVQM